MLCPVLDLYVDWRTGEGEPVWLTPHLRDPQPEGEREREWTGGLVVSSLGTNRTEH